MTFGSWMCWVKEAFLVRLNVGVAEISKWMLIWREKETSESMRRQWRDIGVAADRVTVIWVRNCFVNSFSSLWCSRRFQLLKVKWDHWYLDRATAIERSHVLFIVSPYKTSLMLDDFFQAAAEGTRISTWWVFCRSQRLGIWLGFPRNRRRLTWFRLFFCLFFLGFYFLLPCRS